MECNNFFFFLTTRIIIVAVVIIVITITSVNFIVLVVCVMHIVVAKDPMLEKICIKKMYNFMKLNELPSLYKAVVVLLLLLFG